MPETDTPEELELLRKCGAAYAFSWDLSVVPAVDALRIERELDAARKERDALKAEVADAVRVARDLADALIDARSHVRGNKNRALRLGEDFDNSESMAMITAALASFRQKFPA